MSQSAQNSKQIPPTTSSVELALKDDQSNLDQEDTKYEVTGNTIKIEPEIKEVNDNNDETKCKYFPDMCCMGKVNKIENNDYNNDNDIATSLNEDIWALGYVIARNRGKLPCTFVILMSVIYFVQLTILCTILWAYEVEDTQTYKTFNILRGGQCRAVFNDTAYHFSNGGCSDIRISEAKQRRQVWRTEEIPWRTAILSDTENNKEILWDTFEYSNIGVWPITAMLSFLLLGFYISSSMTNPIIMFIMAHRYNNV